MTAPSSAFSSCWQACPDTHRPVRRTTVTAGDRVAYHRQRTPDLVGASNPPPTDPPRFIRVYRRADGCLSHVTSTG